MAIPIKKATYREVRHKRMKDWKEQLKPRSKYTLSQNEQPQALQNIFLTAPCDWGVMRNGGKNGARFAPDILLNLFKKMAKHQDNSQWSTHQVVKKDLAAHDFSGAQDYSYQKIKSILSPLPSSSNEQSPVNIFHLAAGHDHIYPLAKAVLEIYGKAIILNIDAHLDTRVDELPHSGTPFRQLHNEFNLSKNNNENNNETRLTLAQLGIHKYANTPHNYEEMGDMNILSMEECHKENKLQSWLDQILSHNQGPLILSLDCDGIDGPIMPAVSAANHDGLNKTQMKVILESCIQYWNKFNSPRLFGLYEYNPQFDDLHCTSGRYLSSLIHRIYNTSETL